MVLFCNTCGQSFVSSSNRKRHMERRHKDEDEKESMDEEQESGSLKFVDNDNESTDEDSKPTVEQEESSESEDDDEEEEDTVNVWTGIALDAAAHFDGDAVESYIETVLDARRLRNDPVHQKVMSTLKRIRQDEEDMDFDEALAKAVKKRKYVIIKAAKDSLPEIDTDQSEAEEEKEEISNDPNLQ